MSVIKCVYLSGEPSFPATDQHPDAMRYTVGRYVVDAVGGEPTLSEIEAILNPPTVAQPVVSLPDDADLPTLAAFVKQLAERAG